MGHEWSLHPMPWSNAKIDQDRSLSMKDHILRLHILILFSCQVGERTCGRCNTKICQEWILSNIWTYLKDFKGCFWVCVLEISARFVVQVCSGHVPIFHFTLGPALPLSYGWRKQIWQLLRRASLWMILPACLRQHCCPVGAAFRFN